MKYLLLSMFLIGCGTTTSQQTYVLKLADRCSKIKLSIDSTELECPTIPAKKALRK
jgi:hypothetical protein